MLVDDTQIEHAAEAMETGLNSLIFGKGNKYCSRVCIICDRLLSWKDNKYISLLRLRSLSKPLMGTTTVKQTIPKQLRSYYTYRGEKSCESIKKMLLSPRGFYDCNEKGFLCCRACASCLVNKIAPSKVVVPKFSVANGMAFGEPPAELVCLNAVELAMISQARIDKHVFSLFGGAHKQMVGWHNMYENNTNHVGGVMSHLKDFGITTTIACILTGPFTPEQRTKAWKQTEVRPSLVLSALVWLKKNNRNYKEYKLPNQGDIPQPIIIDKSETVQSVNTDIERRYEYTVVFPETDDITKTNGGYMTKEEFKKNIIDALDSTTTITLLASPTQKSIRDYEDDSLLKAFPLQFPYGYGSAPSSMKTGKVAAGTRMEYVQFILQCSIASMHTPSFVLVLHGMYEKHRAVTDSFLKCKNRDDGDSTRAEMYSKLDIDTLKSAFASKESGEVVRNPVARNFLRDIDGVCKSMGHTNDAAKKARLHMFANIVRFGIPALFLSITPDDGNSYRLKVYAEQKSKAPPAVDSPDNLIEEDLIFNLDLRQRYPGLCAFEFQQITELVIEHILGWDSQEKQSKHCGGAFGKLDAWCCAVEEQGRKTLHHHWVLWVHKWSHVLTRLHSEDRIERKEAQKELETYVDRVMSNTLFGTEKNEDLNRSTDIAKHLAAEGYRHNCSTTGNAKVPFPRQCTAQELRNLRYEHGTTDYGGKAITECKKCKKTFTALELEGQVLKILLGPSSKLQNRMKLAVKRFSVGMDRPRTEEQIMRRKFIIGANCNHHDEGHKSSCFKKGYECRFCMPTLPCKNTRTRRTLESNMNWWNWSGTKSTRTPFLVEQKRHVFDVFMNTFSVTLTDLLCCNTNVQCGIDGAHIIYATLYASKGTQVDDSKAYINTAAALYARLKKQLEVEKDVEGNEIENSAVTPTPFSEGYRRLLSAVFSHTKAHVTSAPMAWFIVQNGGRFLFSHESAYICLDAFVGNKYYSSVKQAGKSLYIVDKMAQYTHRPISLHNVSLYDFVSNYQVVLTKRTAFKTLKFTGDYEHKHVFGVQKRKVPVTPLVNHSDFPSAKTFGRDIFSESDDVPDGAMEQFAKAAFTLFIPFRNSNLHRQETNVSFFSLFRGAIKNGLLKTSARIMLQNIQDCKNMLAAGRQPDVLERMTVSVPGLCKTDKKETKEDVDVAKYIEEHLTDLVAEMDRDDALIKQRIDKEGILMLFMDELTKKNKMQDPKNEILGPTEVKCGKSIFALDGPNYTGEEKKKSRKVEYNNPDTTKEDLAKLLCTRVVRSVDNKVSSVTANGTAQSITLWAEEAFSFSDHKKVIHVDQDQKRAFEVIVSTFILTYVKEIGGRSDFWGSDGRSEGSDGKRQRLSKRATNTRINTERSKLVRLQGTNKEQLIMFLTGAGGSGKSRVISQVLSYSQAFCKKLGVVFTKRTIVVTAMTGVAATMIDGETLNSAAHFQSKEITVNHIEEWKDARLLIIDEVSFASKNDIVTLNHKLGQLKQSRHARYGGMHVIFTGDFAQLEPVKAIPLYAEQNFAMWHEWMNCFMELTGQHRYGNDPQYGEIMNRLRIGVSTPSDFAILNSRLVGGKRVKVNGKVYNPPTKEDIPAGVAYAVFANKCRSMTNNAIFSQHLKETHHKWGDAEPPEDTLVIRADKLKWKTNKKNVNTNGRHCLWTRCSDADVQTSGERGKYVDPCLKLYTGIPVMYMENDNVEDKKANGMLCRVKKVVLYKNKEETANNFARMNIDGYYVRSVGASKVKCIVCEYGPPDNAKEIVVEATDKSCRVLMPCAIIPGEEPVKAVTMYINRFPILVNHATTGHKLQGQTKPEGVMVKEWDYRSNWPYVVLTRVTSLSGLFLQKPIDGDKIRMKDKRLFDMLKAFGKKTPAQYIEFA